MFCCFTICTGNGWIGMNDVRAGCEIHSRCSSFVPFKPDLHKKLAKLAGIQSLFTPSVELLDFYNNFPKRAAKSKSCAEKSKSSTWHILMFSCLTSKRHRNTTFSHRALIARRWMIYRPRVLRDHFEASLSFSDFWRHFRGIHEFTRLINGGRFTQKKSSPLLTVGSVRSQFLVFRSREWRNDIEVQRNS